MIDVNDLNKLDCDSVRKAIEVIADPDSFNFGREPYYQVVEEFLEQVEAIQRKYTKPIAALLKKDCYAKHQNSTVS